MTDPFEPLTHEPVSLIKGRFCSWTISDDFAPATYTVKYVFYKDDSAVDLDGSYDGTNWLFEANAAFTTALEVGRHIIDLVVTRISDAETTVIRTSNIQCFGTPADRTSHSQIMVDKIESILSGRADSDVDSYTIKSRSISKMSVKELTEWREYYLAELGRAPDPLTGKKRNNNTVKVGFI